MIKHVPCFVTEPLLKDKLLPVILTNSNDIIAIYRLNGDCQYISPAVKKIMGYLPEEIIGRSCLDYCYPEDRLDMEVLFDNVKNERPVSITRVECRYRHKDGGYCWLEAEGSRFPKQSIR